MLGLSDVTRTSRVRSLTARELPLAVEVYLVYCRSVPFNHGFQTLVFEQVMMPWFLKHLVTRVSDPGFCANILLILELLFVIFLLFNGLYCLENYSYDYLCKI